MIIFTYSNRMILIINNLLKFLKGKFNKNRILFKLVPLTGKTRPLSLAFPHIKWE